MYYMKCSIIRCKNEATDNFKMCLDCRTKQQNYLKSHPEQLIKKQLYNANYMKNKRKDPAFRLKELEYMSKYCEKRGITLRDLWDKIKFDK